MYNYQEIKQELFKEENQETFLEVRDKVKQLLKTAGAFTITKAMSTGDSWINMACVDRLVELKEIVEVPTQGWAQHRIFTSPK